eukprot:CAMPEP_0172448988 /NCGR_PEP_ID=MMETSP1065-20121228/7840_1 /TAXON_ID=265537 /ORGANISM="Amphiprora paludosa, Strain CCMP125" /LENGTH=230 /DNA_ID=CAMNT_0013200587 /DNA_START=189 /DNA_END=881 /DNA_ORIENTATION=+
MSMEIVCKPTASMMNFMKRDRRSGSNNGGAEDQASKSSPATTNKGLFFSKKNRCDSTGGGSTGDESSSSGPENGKKRAAWHAGNFLASGPPRDADWWSEKDDTSSSFSSMDDVKRTSSMDSDDQRSGVTSGKREFRNRGLEIWEKTRKAWNNTPATQPSSSLLPNSTKKSISFSSPGKLHSKPNRSLSRFRRRELMKNLQSERQFQLPQQMGLKDLIGVYNEIWNEDKSD